jgi:hypothetical protein
MRSAKPQIAEASDALPPPTRIEAPRRSVETPRTVKRVFTLDSALGEVEVTVKGPAGACKLQSTHETLYISTGSGDSLPVAGPIPKTTVAARRSTAQPSSSVLKNLPPELVGDDSIPGAGVSEELPGDDMAADGTGREIEDTIEAFLAKGEKALMRSVQNE